MTAVQRRLTAVIGTDKHGDESRTLFLLDIEGTGHSGDFQCSTLLRPAQRRVTGLLRKHLELEKRDLPVVFSLRVLART